MVVFFFFFLVLGITPAPREVARTAEKITKSKTTKSTIFASIYGHQNHSALLCDIHDVVVTCLSEVTERGISGERPAVAAVSGAMGC